MKPVYIDWQTLTLIGGGLGVIGAGIGLVVKVYKRVAKQEENTKQIEELKGETKVSEGVDANYMDMINYAVFGLIKNGIAD